MVFEMKLLFLLGLASFAYGVKNMSEDDEPLVELFKPITPDRKEWNGVVRIGRCSGALMKSWTGDKPPANASAYVITCGHCFGDFQGADFNKLLFDMPFDTTARINDYTDREKANPPVAIQEVAVRKVRFATMKLTDIAVIELDKPAADLVAQGYRFYPIANSIPTGSSFKVGFPWKFSMIGADTVMGVSSAFIEAWGHEIEMGYAYDGAAWYGFSGSSHFVNGGTVHCITSHGHSTKSGFCQRVDYINACFDANGVFDFARPGCFGDYKLRMYERYNEVLPGFQKEEAKVDGGSAKFGDKSTEVIKEKIQTSPGKANDEVPEPGSSSGASAMFSTLSVLSMGSAPAAALLALM